MNNQQRAAPPPSPTGVQHPPAYGVTIIPTLGPASPTASSGACQLHFSSTSSTRSPTQCDEAARYNRDDPPETNGWSAEGTAARVALTLEGNALQILTEKRALSHGKSDKAPLRLPRSCA